MDILTYVVSFLWSMGLSYILIRAVSRLFAKKDILDNPKKYGKKRDPIPYSVGITFFITFFVMSFLFVDWWYKLFLIWAFWWIITLVSFFDDMVSLSAKTRLTLQILIGAIIGITSIKIGYVSNIFGGIVDLHTLWFDIAGYDIYIIPLLFTIVWYVFVFNALNWSDGIQGNTSWLSLICFIVIFFLWVKLYITDGHSALRENAEFIMQMCIILIGMLIPFFFFDFREKILMGDSGTMFLGFMLATLAIISGGKIATVLAVFGIYAIDAIYVIIRRLIQKKNPMNGDFTHLHHRLGDIGFTNNQVLTIIFTTSFFFGITSLFLDKTGKIIVFAIIWVLVVFLSYFGEKVKKITFKK